MTREFEEVELPLNEFYFIPRFKQVIFSLEILIAFHKILSNYPVPIVHTPLIMGGLTIAKKR